MFLRFRRKLDLVILIWTIFTPRTCARGKAIGRVVVVIVVVQKKIARSWDLGTSATRKYNKSVEVGKKLASGCLESGGMAYKLHKSCISVGNPSHTHRPSPLCIMHEFLLMCIGLICVGKGRPQHNIMSKLHDNADAMQGTRGVCALRALVNNSYSGTTRMDCLTYIRCQDSIWPPARTMN